MLLKTLQNEIDKHILLLNDFHDMSSDPYDQEALEIKDHYQKHLKHFFINFWKNAGTSNEMVVDISLDCVVEHLKASMAGEFKTLLFVMPPRQGKSTLFSVMFPAYLWAVDPRTRLLTSCYAPEYAFRDNKNMQDLILSEEYQYLWGKDFQLTKTSKERTKNTVGGIRVATSIQGKNTGEGGTYVIMDDVNNVTAMHSQTILQKTNDTVNRLIVTRQNFASQTRFIMAQHRCSHSDAIGAWLAKNDGDTCYVNIPMEYEIKRRSVTVSKEKKILNKEGKVERIIPSKIIWEDPRSKEGELLSPVRYGEKDIQFLKTHMGESTYAALYQGLPVIGEATVFKEEWFKFWPYAFMPEFDRIIQSWDTALSTDDNACFSACTTWGVFKPSGSVHNHIMLLSMWTGKKEWHELFKMMKRLAHNYEDTNYNHPLNYGNKPDIILVEAKANGLNLIQQMNRIGVNCTPYNPPRRKNKMEGSFEDAKTVRARLCSPLVESGKVWVPTNSPDHDTPRPFADQFIRGCTIFPSNAHDTRDIVDTFTMTVDWLRERGILYTTYDLINQVEDKPKRHMVFG